MLPRNPKEEPRQPTPPDLSHFDQLRLFTWKQLFQHYVSEKLGKLLKEGYLPQQDLSQGWGNLSREELVSLLMWAEYKSGVLAELRYEHDVAAYNLEMQLAGKAGINPAAVQSQSAPASQAKQQQQQSEDDQLKYHEHMAAFFQGQNKK